MRYIGWMDILVRVLFISPQNVVDFGKSKATSTKEPRTAQAGCTTTSTERRAHRTAHFTAARNPAACIYFSACARVRFTHRAVISKAYVKKSTIVTYQVNEPTTPARKK